MFVCVYNCILYSVLHTVHTVNIQIWVLMRSEVCGGVAAAVAATVHYIFKPTASLMAEKNKCKLQKLVYFICGWKKK